MVAGLRHTLEVAYSRSSNKSLRRQFLQQRLRLLQIAHVEPFSEPTVNRSQQFARSLHLTLVAPEAREDRSNALRGQQPRGVPLFAEADDRAGLETFDWQTGEGARSEFDSIFAPHILQYPDAKIIFDGNAVEPGRTVDRAHEFPKESIICLGRVIKDLTLRVIESKAHVPARKIYFGGETGVLWAHSLRMLRPLTLTSPPTPTAADP
jgi:hypothetical protein